MDGGGGVRFGAEDLEGVERTGIDMQKAAAAGVLRNVRDEERKD